MTAEERFWQQWIRHDKEESRALPSYRYGQDPANFVKFDREKGEYMDRIKELLREWACYYQDGYGTGYPKQSAFAQERVQNSNRSTDTYRDIPADIVKVNDFIENGLAPSFKLIVKMEYRDKRPQKTKAAVMDMARSVYCQRLAYAHEQLNHMMWGM